MKYTIQNRQYDCGPVAIFNAIRYFNRNTPYKTLGRIRRICITNTFREAVKHKNLLKALDRFFHYEILYLEKEENKNRYSNQILEHLRRKPILLQHDSVPGHGHMVFVEKYSKYKNKMYLWNYTSLSRLHTHTHNPKSFERTQFVVFLHNLK